MRSVPSTFRYATTATARVGGTGVLIQRCLITAACDGKAIYKGL
jgi:hypothetical protein